MIEVDEDFWNQRYSSGETGWVMHQVSPPLKSYIDSLKKKDTRILIPGCGNAHEAYYLDQKGFTNVTLVDISSILVSRLKKELKTENIRIVHSDFFNHKGEYDLILEQTFFCAILPSRRKDYVRHAHDLLSKKGKIAGVLFNEKFGFDDHPPFTGTEKEYRELFSPFFNILKLEPCRNSIKPRMGNEFSIEFQKKDI